MNYSVQKDISIGSRMKHQGYVVLLKKCVSFYLKNLFRLHEVTTFTPCEDNLNMIDNYVKLCDDDIKTHVNDVKMGDVNDVKMGDDNVNMAMMT